MSETIDVEDYKERYDVLLADHAKLKKIYDELMFKYEKLRRRLLGPTKERVSTEANAQLSLLAVLEALGRLGTGDASAAKDVEDALERAKKLCERDDEKKKRNKPTGRRDLKTENLRVVRIVIQPAERLAPGGERLVQIGEEVSEHLDRRAASLVRVQWVRPIYADPDESTSDAAVARTADVAAAVVVDGAQEARVEPEPVADTIDPSVIEGDIESGESAIDVDVCTAAITTSEHAPGVPPTLGAPLAAAQRKRRVVVADLPDRPVPRCMAGPGLLAHVLVAKYADHLPLDRQERIFKRDGVPIAKSTLCGWVAASTAVLSRIVEAMWKDTRESAAYCVVDATGVLVLAKDRCRRCHFYVVVVPKEHVLFRFTVNNGGEDVARVLDGISGYVHADAASVYHETYRKADDVVEVGCWAHARRKFFEALSRDRERAMIGIGFISLLYDAHRAALDKKTRVADRDKRAAAARPILARILRWVRKELRVVEKGTPIHVALGYVTRQWAPLTRFLDDGQLRLDTNPAELALRREVVGRKNWLFCGSDGGAGANAIAVSLIASCDMHEIEPWAYLRDVLMLLPGWCQTRVLELSPKHWKATSSRPDVQRRLAELRALHPSAHTPPAEATAAIWAVEHGVG